MTRAPHHFTPEDSRHSPQPRRGTRFPPSTGGRRPARLYRFDAWIALTALAIGAASFPGIAVAGGDVVTRLRPADGVIGPLSRARGCALTRYEGASTPLYSDRPYHTDVGVPELRDRVFCRGKRHGQEIWILDVTDATNLYTLASASHGLEAGGWRPLATPVRVEAAGLAFDRLYVRRIEPGRFAIHYGHATTANPVFFDPSDARVVAIPAPGDG